MEVPANVPALFLYLLLPGLFVEGLTMVLGLTRRSKYQELQKQRDELMAYMNVLTGEVGKLRKEVADLRKETKGSKQRAWQLQQDISILRIQKEGLANSVEILTKEREIFQRTIETLCQATRKQKQSPSFQQ